MARTGAQRLEAIMPAIAARDAFLERVGLAEGNREFLADLMAEAIEMHLAANGLEVVKQNGQVVVSVEDISASHCLKAARDAYIRTAR